MEESNTAGASATGANAAITAGANADTTASAASGNPALTQQQQQQQLFQQQLFLLHQYQQHQQQHQQQPQTLSLQQQHQLQAMSRFPSNIDAHLRAPGMRSLHLQQQQVHPPPPPPPANPSAAAAAAAAQQLQQQAAKAAAARQGGNPIEVEMAHQDAMKICNPDVKRPFASIEDAVLRLLPYHVVSDFEAEEDDRILDSDTTGQVPSRLQQWDHNILAKIAEFTTTFEKQVLAFNIMSKKRALGEFRAEERLVIEQCLLQEEKQAIMDIKAEMESREKANREAQEAKMRMAMAQAEQARAQAQMMAWVPMRASVIGSQLHGDDVQDAVGPEQEMMNIHGWGNNSGKNNNNGNNNDGQQRDEEEPSEDFLNDENDNEDDGDEEESGELDLNDAR